MIKTRKPLAALLALCLSVSGISIAQAPPALAETMTDTHSMVVGGSETFSFTNGTINSISSSAPSVLSVSNNTSTATMTALTAGTALVTVNYYNTVSLESHSLIITVSVTNTSTTTSTNSSSISLTAGQTQSLGSYYAVTNLYSSNPTVASISQSNGLVSISGLSAGSTVFSFTAYSSSSDTTGTTYSFAATVYSASSTTSTSTSSTSFSMKVGQKASTGTYSSLSNLSSSNEAIATAAINDNKITVTAVGEGEAVISYTSAGSISQSIKITVSGFLEGSATSVASSTESSNDEGITFKSYTRSYTLGKKYRVSNITLNGVEVEASELRWLSADTSILTVNSSTGLVRTIAAGETKLIAVDPDGNYARSISVSVS